MSTSPAKRGPYAKSAEKRAAIAKAAYEVVMEVGHPQLTTQAVAARAGLLDGRCSITSRPATTSVAAIEYFEGFFAGEGANARSPRRRSSVTSSTSSPTDPLARTSGCGSRWRLRRRRRTRRTRPTSSSSATTNGS